MEHKPWGTVSGTISATWRKLNESPYNSPAPEDIFENAHLLTRCPIKDFNALVIPKGIFLPTSSYVAGTVVEYTPSLHLIDRQALHHLIAPPTRPSAKMYRQAFRGVRLMVNDETRPASQYLDLQPAFTHQPRAFINTGVDQLGAWDMFRVTPPSAAESEAQLSANTYRTIQIQTPGAEPLNGGFLATRKIESDLAGLVSDTLVDDMASESVIADYIKKVINDLNVRLVTHNWADQYQHYIKDKLRELFYYTLHGTMGYVLQPTRQDAMPGPYDATSNPAGTVGPMDEFIGMATMANGFY